MSLRLLIILSVLSLPVVCKGQEAGSSPEQAQQDSLAVTEADDFVTASLLVTTPSDVLYSCVGHASLRMQCPHHNLDMVYTYESEPVTDRVLTFLKGDLNMGMTAVPTERVLADYASEGRGITEYVINIPLDKRKQLWQYLDGKVEEGMNLPYDYLNRGCVLGCLRAIRDAVLPDTISFGEWDEKFVNKSRRTLLGDRIGDFPWARFFIFTIAGTEADQACAVMDKVVVPLDLIEVLQKATFNGKALIGEPKELVGKTIDISQGGWATPVTLACILLLLAVISWFWMQRPLSLLLLALHSAFALVVTYLVLISTLPNTSFSWLIIPFNPLPLILWRWRKWWLLPFGMICIGWCIVMLTRVNNPLVDPAHIVLALAFAVNFIGQWKQLKNINNIKINKRK